MAAFDETLLGARPLLATKLHAPRVRPGTIRRTRLSGRVQAGATVTLVSAPAGFGKSTLVAEWCSSMGADDAVAWVSLDAGDNDPAVFWTYVLVAIQRAALAAGSDALAALQSSQPLDSVVATLVNGLHDAPDPILVVLDDYHLIESAEIHDSVAFLIEQAPPSLRVVIATRSDPPLPLARLRARGRLSEVRAADLRFTPDEATAYLNDTMGLDLTADDVAALGARTEGWIAALQLAALSLEGRDDPSRFIAGFAGDDRFVVDYLVEEVLERQPDDVRSFLLETAVLDRLTGPLCDAVTERSGGRAMLDRLHRANLFVVALDDRRQWYRYHHLFADVLCARLLDEEPELVGRLHGRASEWYESVDDRSAAIAHALAGGLHARAAQLIELAAPELRQSRQEGTLRRWLEALPEHMFVGRPVLAIGLVGARMATGDATAAEPLLRSVEAMLADPDRELTYFDVEMFDRLPAQVLVQRAGLNLLAGDVQGTIDQATRALELLEPGDHLRRGSATALLALAQWTAGDLDAAAQRYGDVLDAFVAAGHLADMLGCSISLADILIAQGRLSDAKRTYEAGLRATTDHPGLRGAADMHVGLAEVLIERNQLDDAERHLEISADLGESAGLPQHAYRWRVTMARWCRARGDIARALELIDEAAPRYDTDYSPPVRPVDAIRARVQLAAGDVDAAAEWAARRGLGVDDELRYVDEYAHITLARVLIARHEVADAANLLERLLVAAEAGSRTAAVIEVRILQAAALHELGHVDAAAAALEDARRRAEPEGHVRLFLHAGSAPVRRADVSLVDPLSARELDVLRWLRTDLTGPEIARQLHVSLNTLRSHTKSIFSKLGATTRREALTRATELGL